MNFILEMYEGLEMQKIILMWVNYLYVLSYFQDK